MATTATQVTLDTPAAEFRLPATDGKTYALDDVAGEKGTVVVLICNHVTFCERALTTSVNDIEHIESQSIPDFGIPLERGQVRAGNDHQRAGCSKPSNNVMGGVKLYFGMGLP
jgi:hypothetical protein